MLTDQEVRLRCFELAYQYCAKNINGMELGSLFDTAEKIYKFVCDNRPSSHKPSKFPTKYLLSRL